MIARTQIDGARLTDLAELTRLPHPSVRRILKCLIDERLVVQDAATRRHQLGALNYELGLTATHRPPVQESLRALIQRVARLTSDSACLNVRSGVGFICLDRAPGRLPIQTLTQNVGERRPLGFGAAGTALLAARDDAEVERVLVDKPSRDRGASPLLARQGATCHRAGAAGLAMRGRRTRR